MHDRKDYNTCMDFTKLFTLQFVMFAELMLGYALCRMNILKPQERGVLSRLVVYLLLPCNIVHAFRVELSEEVIGHFVEIFVISCGIQVLCTLLAHTLYNRVPLEKRKILQYATVCSNAGFLGNAVADGVYGSMGLLYAQIYLIPVRIVMWTAGVSYFAQSSDRRGMIRSILTHPCIIAVIVGIVRMVLQIPVPAPAENLLSVLGSCATPLIMLFLGMILAEAGFGNMLEKTNMIFSVIRLVLIPAVVWLVCRLFHADTMITGLSVLLAAMPAGTTTAVLAEQYHADEEFAANCVILTTLLSIGLLPVWVWLVETL